MYLELYICLLSQTFVLTAINMLFLYVKAIRKSCHLYSRLTVVRSCLQSSIGAEQSRLFHLAKNRRGGDAAGQACDVICLAQRIKVCKLSHAYLAHPR